MIRTEMQTSVTVEKSVLLNGANIIAAQRFTVPGLSLGFNATPKAIGVPIVCTHYREKLICCGRAPNY